MKRGERVEDRKFTSRVDARAGRGGGGGEGWVVEGGRNVEPEGEERFNAFPR